MPESAVPSLQLERELEEARLHGRWLSDDERAELAEQQRQQTALREQQRRQRRNLLILTGVCVLIPPLWPVAAGLTLYLLFPRTARRLALAAGLSALVLGVLLAGLIIAVVIALLMAVF
jgi:phage terminase Nu1 subunit (DNA packaging protein)